MNVSTRFLSTKSPFELCSCDVNLQRLFYSQKTGVKYFCIKAVCYIKKKKSYLIRIKDVKNLDN